MTAMKSDWNPEGHDYNCMACVARYLLEKLAGKRLHSWESAHLDAACQPHEQTGHAGNLAFQQKTAIHRTVALIEGVGLKAAQRLPAALGNKYPVGHYAVIGLGTREGHVIYGRVDQPNSDFSEMFCPQSNVPARYGRLGGHGLAVRFEVSPKQ